MEPLGFIGKELLRKSETHKKLDRPDIISYVKVKKPIKLTLNLRLKYPLNELMINFLWILQ